MSSQDQARIDFYRLVGLRDNDPIVIGKNCYRKAINTIRDIPKFMGQEQIYITPNPVRNHRLKANVMRYVTCYSDLDFCDYELAMRESENLMAIMDHYGFYYGLVCSGRGLQLYVPVNIDDLGMGEELNQVLNRFILREYYRNRIIDRSLITNYATFLRLPGTINSKNGKMARILHHNFDPGVDYFTHNYEILLNELKAFLNASPRDLSKEPNPMKFDFCRGSFHSLLFERMIGLDLQIIQRMRAKGTDRKLNSHLFPSLAVYVQGHENRMQGAIEFVKRIKGDSDNLRRWIVRAEEYAETGDAKKKVVYNAVALKNWAEHEYGRDDLITRLAQADCDRLKYHNGYYKFIESNLNYDSLDDLRADMDRFVRENSGTAGFHWLIGETGVGKSTTFDRLIQDGSKVVSLVPYLMLMYNMNRPSVYTFDSVSYSHRQRTPLVCDMMDSDLIVADEVHCMKTFRSISKEKAQKLDQLDATLKEMIDIEHKPVFLLTSTPSVEQITDIEHPNASKFIGFIKKDNKKVSLHIIDQGSIHQAVANHNKVMIFIDHREEVRNAKAWLENYGIEHRIFTVTKDEKPEEKRRIEHEIKSCEKFVVIGTSSVSSGINIPLDTIILTNRIMNQQTLYQVLGRLRIVNKPDQVHRIYILNQSTYRIPNWADSMDMFEFVSPRVLIKYISRLYKIVEIKDLSRSSVVSFNRLNKTADVVRLMKSTRHISDYYALPEVQEKQLYLIPVDAIRELGKSGWIDVNSWTNISYREITRLGPNDEHPHGMKVKCRNREYGYHAPVWHYFDQVELCRLIEGHHNPKRFMRSLPKSVREAVLRMGKTNDGGGQRQSTTWASVA